MGCPGASRSAPRQLISTLIRRQEGKNRVFSHGWVAQARRSDFSMSFLDFRFCRKMENRPEVRRLPTKTEVRPFALRVESLARSNLEKHENQLPNRPKIVENRVPGTLGRPSRSTFVARSSSVERLDRLLSLGAARTSEQGELARSPGRSSLHARLSSVALVGQFRCRLYIR